MFRRFPFAAALACAVATPAVAGSVVVQVKDAAGKPVANAVVTVHLQGRATPAPKVGGPYEIEQKNIQFIPFVTIVPTGADVAFPNRDSVRHHVYSFSSAKKFELKLYAREQNRTVRFDNPGIVALGCNIHDAMTAFIAVVDTVWAVRTDGSGMARISGIPGGAASVEVWHPYLRAPGNTLSRDIKLVDSDTQAQAFAVTLRAPPKTANPAY